MSEKRFRLLVPFQGSRQVIIKDCKTCKSATVDIYDDNIDYFVDLLNSLSEENEQLRTQLLICQQSKNDNGGFQVWEVSPIPKGMRITFTTSDGDLDE